MRVLPDEIALHELPRGDGTGIAIGVEELTLARVELDLADADQHLIALGEPGSGRSGLLRMLAHSLCERYSPDQARLVVVDFRRTLADLAGLPLPCTFASRPPQVEQALAELRELTVERLHELDSLVGWRAGAARTCTCSSTTMT